MAEVPDPDLDGTVSWAELLAEATTALAVGGVPSAAIDARRIVEEASGHDGTTLHAHLSDLATVNGVAALDAMVTRRIAGEPLQYVVGRWGFRTLDLMVDRRVLIPRPETEGVVDHVVAELDARRAERAPGDRIVVDLGCGSGAIGLAVAAERPGTEVHLADLSADAVAVTRANLAGLGLTARSVSIHQGSWFAPLPADLAGRVDVVVANPPYIAAGESLPPVVADWEPTGALVAGPSGLEAVQVLVADAAGWLRPGGLLVVEIGATQGAAARDLAIAAGLVDAEIRPDLAGRDRALLARSPHPPDPASPPDPDLVDRLCAALQAGEPVVIPTDTVYGLAALPSVPGATARLYALKDRRPDVPLAVLLGDPSDLAAVAADGGRAAAALVTRHWPGPLTLVVARHPDRTAWDLGGDPTTIGVRCPAHPLVRAVAARVGPIATTSANRHGQPTPPAAAAAAGSLTGPVAVVADGGTLAGRASTVVDLTGSRPTVLREGDLSAEDLDLG